MQLDKITPIVILGVPRSGTTLLRVLLDSHSMVAGAPETPWLTGGYGDFSIRSLVESLNDHKIGPVQTLIASAPSRSIMFLILLNNILSIYAMIVAMRAIGLFYRHFKHKLPWKAE